MKSLLITCIALFFSVVTFAQENAPSISVDQVEEATTIQQLLPKAYGEEKGIVSYVATVAIERQKLRAFSVSGDVFDREIKKLILANKNEGKKIVLYMDATKYNEDGVQVKLPSTAVIIQ